MNFRDFCIEAEKIDQQIVEAGSSVVISFGKLNGTTFNIDPSDIVSFLDFMSTNHELCKSKIESDEEFNKASYTIYQQNPYRSLYKFVGDEGELKTIASLGGSQTVPLTNVISKFICFFAKIPYCKIEENTHFDLESINAALGNVPKDLTLLSADNRLSSIGNNIKLAFQNWLQSKNKSSKTIKEYSGTVINCANTLLFGERDSDNSLYIVNSIDSAEKFIQPLQENSEWSQKNLSGNGMYQAGLNMYMEFLRGYFNFVRLPKPFLLLAGISGTGKSRFVREQAQRHATHYPGNFKSIAVRPDWHEPSDLLGYVTRISGNASYVVPELLKFIVSAWKNAASGADENAIQYHSTAEMVPYWLCLDEMNLAPVEQYFADYLSVLESRKWEAGNYSCDALLSKEVIASVDDPLPLRTALGLDGHSLWDYFCKNGIPLPPNLIVAGTVNMDETTHGFSRKVIDRAFTIDFGAFYPNDLDQYFAKTQFAKTLSFPLLSAVTQLELADIKDSEGIAVDADGVNSIAFLEALNSVLRDTPFELAYRALNELLMAVVCFQPKNELELHAVWDDFLMTKVLPRIDGDVDKLKDRTPDADKSDTDGSLLKQLETVLEQQLPTIWNDAESRLDLLRVDKDDKPFNIACRAKKKLKWMRDRLKDNGFTTFWP